MIFSENCFSTFPDRGRMPGTTAPRYKKFFTSFVDTFTRVWRGVVRCDARRSRLSRALRLVCLGLYRMNLASTGAISRLLQSAADLVALFVDRGDRRPHGDAEGDERRLRKLQARFDRLGHGIGGAELVQMAGVIGIARTRDDNDV